MITQAGDEKPIRLPWYPWYYADFRLSTMTWSREAQHAYRDLLEHQWEYGHIPRGWEERAQVCGLEVPAIKQLWSRYLRPKFKKMGKHGWQNPRMASLRAQAIEKTMKLRMAGQKGGRAGHGGPEKITDFASRTYKAG